MLFIGMEYNKKDLEHLILKQKLSYIEIGKRYGVSGTFIKKKSKQLGIELPRRKSFPLGFVPHNKGQAKEYKCFSCDKKILKDNHANRKYCSIECSSNHRVASKWKNYLDNQDEYCDVWNMSFVKKHILKEQGGRCKICSMDSVWEGKPIVFTLDHIDGNGKNNKWSNLRCVTPLENNRNLRKASNNTSGFTGVCWHEPTKKWQARIVVNKKTKSLGLYLSVEEAAIVRKNAEAMLGFHPNHGSDRPL